MIYKFSPTTLSRDRNGSMIIFNLEDDELLVEMKGTYSGLVQNLVTGATPEALALEHKLSIEEITIFLNNLGQAGIFENIPKAKGSIETKVFALSGVDAKVTTFNEYLPQVDPNSSYASYCACNSCCASDASQCCAPPYVT